jgi:hypothetical protein
MATIAVTHPLVLAFNCEWTGDRQHASHQGALDSGGDTPEGSKVHAARVPGDRRRVMVKRPAEVGEVAT